MASGKSNTPSGGSSTQQVGTKKRSLGKVLLLCAGGVVGVGAILVILAPTIASSVAPGMIESAAGRQIKGSVRVQGLSLGWFSGTSVGPVEVRDASGKVAARVEVSTPVSVWTVLSQSWWSARRLDVGTITLAGMVDIERDAQGKSSLEKAIEPKTPVPAGAGATKPAGSSSGYESLKGTLKITNLDVTVRQLNADGSKSPDIGIKGLKGDASVDYMARTIAAKVDMGGAPIGPGSPGAMRIKLDANIVPSAAGSANATGFDKADVKGDISGAPIALIDGLLNLGGGLVSAMGEKADIRVDASGNTQAATAKLVIDSEGTRGNLDLELKDSVLSSVSPKGAGVEPANRFFVRSTQFLALLPQTRESVSKAGQSLRLTGAPPSVEVVLDQLRVPVPPAVISGRGGLDVASIDFSKAALVARANVSAMDGQLALTQGDSSGTTAGASAAPTSWRSFRVEPMSLSINASDLGKPVSIIGGTKATLDGQSAGDVSINASAAGLLDAKGHLRALSKAGGLADQVDADVRVTGMATSLVQPIVAGMNLPIDLRMDVGPTMDLSIQAKADTTGASGSASGAGLPPMNLTMALTSSNITLNAAARVDKNIISAPGDALTLKINALAGLANRILNTPGQAQSLQLSGAGRASVMLKDVSVDLNALRGDAPLAAVRARAGMTLDSLSVLPASFAPGSTSVEVKTFTLSADLEPGKAPAIDVNAALRHESHDFGAIAKLTLDGLKDGKAPKGGGLDAAFKIGANGSIGATNVPRSLLGSVPALRSLLSTQATSGSDMTSQLARAVQASVGNTLSLSTTFAPIAGKEVGTDARLALTTQAQGVGADLNATITGSMATVSTLGLFVSMDPTTINPVLASTAAPGTSPMRIAQPFKLNIASAEAITIPLSSKHGALEPDFARASAATINLSTSGDLAIDNIAVGTDERGQPRTTQVRLSNFAGQLKAPLAGLASDDAKAKSRATGKLDALLARGGGGGGGGGSGGSGAGGDGGKLAELSANVSAAMDGSSPDGSVRLVNVDTSGLDALLGQNGTLAGALGDKADITAKATPSGKTTQIDMDIKATRLQGASIALSSDASRLTLTKPATIVWSPDAKFVNTLIVGRDSGNARSGQALQVSQVSPFTIQLSELTLSQSPATAGQAPEGPMKPGVFKLGATIIAPSLGFLVPSEGKGPANPVTMEGLKIAARSVDGQTPGVDAELSIDRITSTLGSASQRSGARLSIANLADARGVVQTGKAIINMTADLKSFPTALADALARQNGLMSEVLGPTFDASADVKNVTISPASASTPGALPISGTVLAKVAAPRANATIEGNVVNGTFIQSGSTGAKVVEIRPEFVQALQGGLPLIERVTKTLKDAPAALDTEGMQVPLDNDMRKLNGVAKIDPGVVQFVVNSLFGDFLSSSGVKATGSLGNKIEPFVVRFTQGVANYDRFKLPIGTFTIETRGTVDMVQRQLDIITYVPLIGLSEKAVGSIDTGIAGKLGVLDKMTLVPIRTRGSFENQKTEIDVNLFVKETGDKLLKDPGKLIEKGLDDALKGLFDKKPKPKK